MSAHTWKVGDRVLCNGYAGAIGQPETGILAGMATVRMERGQVTVDLHELVLIQPIVKKEAK